MTIDEIKKKTQQIVANKKSLPGALLPILHDIQHEFGHIPEQALSIIGQSLNQTEAEIFGVISFYAHFRMQQTGRHVIEICRGEACQSMGSKSLEQAAQSQLDIKYNQISKDNNFTLEPVYCLGNCACAPSVKVAETVYGRMDSEKFARLTDKLSTYKINVGEIV
ncbi:formate dehydrogenase subunit gamma [Thalassotalea psychrophila]|uniref:NADH-quinone oxidoreductase subunit E n=1 Tax=Thalassotalea psychrophila TaxID=3065647 RepID=A0ABY9TS41_9GAMM|nr:formate dehydrogenase subunit gamma [Colwelliaceae bacterium SQ149]